MAAKTFIASKNVSDLREVRLAGTTKPFEQLTISELTQLRPGGVAADDGWTVQAEASTVTVNGSSILFNLMRERGEAAVQAEAKTAAPHIAVKVSGK